jgi:8-oxo-dGTP diphosphatase
LGVGRFLAGIGAVIWAPDREAYLLLQRAASKDFAPGALECVTGRVDQGEGFEDALHREVREELGVAVVVDFLLGTTHFHRGAALPENELLGVVYHCSLLEPDAIRLSAEHAALRWASFSEALALLRDDHPSEAWLKRALVRAEWFRAHLPSSLIDRHRAEGAELG